MRIALSGMPCDTNHPYPAPLPQDWIDSTEYGALERREHDNEMAMQDVDVTPTWRAIASELWETDCRERHRGEVAADPFLVAHLMACAVRIGLPRGALYELGMQQVGAGAAFNALHDGGLEAGLEAVQRMGAIDRERTVRECVAVVLHGATTLRLDIHDGLVKGVRLIRGS